MPELDDIAYSRDECITAIRGYYDFLTKLYLNESEVIEPPKGGWPSIIGADADTLQAFGKTDEAASLLSLLPYIRENTTENDEPQGAPECYFADWQTFFTDLTDGSASVESMKILTGGGFRSVAPPHTISITYGGRSEQFYVLDTELGILHYSGCPKENRRDPSRELAPDDPYDYREENEEEAYWRANTPAWAVPDFFEVLKDQFRVLRFIAVNPQAAISVYTTRGSDQDGMIEMLQDIYREYRWPDLERYRKGDCLRAVQEALEEKYP